MKKIFVNPLIQIAGFIFIAWAILAAVFPNRPLLIFFDGPAIVTPIAVFVYYKESLKHFLHETHVKIGQIVIFCIAGGWLVIGLSYSWFLFARIFHVYWMIDSPVRALFLMYTALFACGHIVAYGSLTDSGSRDEIQPKAWRTIWIILIIGIMIGTIAVIAEMRRPAISVLGP